MSPRPFDSRRGADVSAPRRLSKGLDSVGVLLVSLRAGLLGVFGGIGLALVGRSSLLVIVAGRVVAFGVLPRVVGCSLVAQGFFSCNRPIRSEPCL